MRIVIICALALVFWPKVADAQSNVLAVSAYLNALYCKGALDVFADRLAAARTSGHRSTAREASRYADKLKSLAASYRKQYSIHDARAKSAESRGRSVMSRELPAKGAWSRGGKLPGEAWRQYQHCLFLAGR